VIDPLRDTPFDRFFFRDPNGYLFEVLEQERGQEDLTK
jgi:catechol 2,3-dioxygenase-like lactoylglutathione lyase family enzyme